MKLLDRVHNILICVDKKRFSPSVGDLQRDYLFRDEQYQLVYIADPLIEGYVAFDGTKLYFLDLCYSTPLIIDSVVKEISAKKSDELIALSEKLFDIGNEITHDTIKLFIEELING